MVLGDSHHSVAPTRPSSINKINRLQAGLTPARASDAIDLSLALFAPRIESGLNKADLNKADRAQPATVKLEILS